MDCIVHGVAKRRPGFNPWVGKIPGEEKGYPLQYSGLENSMDCIVDGVAKSRTWLSHLHFCFPSHLGFLTYFAKSRDVVFNNYKILFGGFHKEAQIGLLMPLLFAFLRQGNQVQQILSTLFHLQYLPICVSSSFIEVPKVTRFLACQEVMVLNHL